MRKPVFLPVIVGSGITVGNIENYWDLADAFIVGSWFKHHLFRKIFRNFFHSGQFILQVQNDFTKCVHGKN
ncbi:MAG: BtpA/SgcQ family protein [Bacteroidota bacterium]|nr:BtpA/SgcQ family protein [Bacteroidota bacterium]